MIEGSTDVEPEAAKEAQPPSKELAIFIPLIGTVIAISYDVGYFYGIDIKFFTLFSVTEHIVFALEAAPIALAVAILVAAFVGPGFDMITGLFEAAQKIPKKRKRYVDAAVLVTVVFVVAAFIYFRWFVGLAGVLIGIGIALFRSLSLSRRTAFLVAGVLVIITAFAFGHDLARS
jgi:hypothetical protein